MDKLCPSFLLYSLSQRTALFTLQSRERECVRACESHNDSERLRLDSTARP